MAKKSDAYEIDASQMVDAELQQGKLGIDPSQAVIKHKPRYYSRDRRKDIEFDVSMEVTRKGETDPFWIWIWECKCYSKNVPVDDVEEFHAKLSQIGADRTKGTIITPVGFSSGALEFARAKGVGLWRWIPKGSIVSLMENQAGPDESDMIRSLTISETSGFRFFGHFYGLTCDGQFSIDRAELIRHEFRDAESAG